MDKKSLTEADISTKFITPALCGANGDKWDVMTQIREEAYFTKGRVIVRGKAVKRGEASKADYILYYKPNIPIAVIEAKDNNLSVGAGMQQALEYAEILDLPRLETQLSVSRSTADELLEALITELTSAIAPCPSNTPSGKSASSRRRSQPVASPMSSSSKK